MIVRCEIDDALQIAERSGDDLAATRDHGAARHSAKPRTKGSDSGLASRSCLREMRVLTYQALTE